MQRGKAAIPRKVRDLPNIDQLAFSRVGTFLPPFPTPLRHHIERAFQSRRTSPSPSKSRQVTSTTYLLKMPPRKSNVSTTSNAAEDGGEGTPVRSTKDGVSVEVSGAVMRIYP